MSYVSAITQEDNVIVWERDENNVRIKRIYPAPYYFYISDPDGEFKTIFDTPVSKLNFKTRKEYYKARTDLTSQFRVWESDIPPEVRVLSNNYYNQPAGKINITLWDIEVDYSSELGFASAKNAYAPINSISMFHMYKDELVVLCVPPPGQQWTSELLMSECQAVEPIPTDYRTVIKVFETEADLLEEFLRQIQDTDLLSGWNSDFFDTPYTAKRIERVLGKHALNKMSFPGAEAPRWEEIERNRRAELIIHLSGRMSLDYLVLFKKYEPGERHSYKLSSIEEEVGLNLPKLEYPGSLQNLYKNDFPFFVRYNMRDSEILRGFELTLGYVDVASQMYHISCGLAQHVQGTLKLAELAIVNYCHHELKRVVPNVTRPDIDRQIDGALVLLPQINMHEYVGSIDIASLYPSAIRSLNISTEKIVGQFSVTEDAQQSIQNKTDDMLLLEYDDGTTDTKTGREWHNYLISNKWAISGYGTVFNQDTPGIIPAVLTGWFATRKKYQADKKRATNNAIEVLMKYMSKEKALEVVAKSTPSIEEVLRPTDDLVDDDELDYDD